MKITDDQFYKGLMVDAVLGSMFSLTAADLIHANLGTKYEYQQYTKEDHHWASIIRGKRFDHTTGREF